MNAISIHRKIGDATVPAIGFGVMRLSANFAGTDEDRLKILDAAYEAGCTFWDTADVYGDNEDIIGKWFKANPEKRSSIFLATKFGVSPTGGKGDPEYVKQQCNKSLERLGVDHIDLYYQHRVDATVPIELTIGAMAELVKEGKVRYLGLSECTSAGLRRAHAVHPIAAVQLEYSPFSLDIERAPLNLLSTARELGVAVAAYAPLGRGLLAGHIKSLDDLAPDDSRRQFPKYSAENFPKILMLVEKIGDIGKKHGATPGQTALAWILAQGENVFLIPGATKIYQLKENIAAQGIKLSEEDIEEIRKAADSAEITGARYPAGFREDVVRR
ncbi:Aldo/keto reductase [Hymenopellis radicata]|nr:Aldo/keto reductase [Hymenopellis radicata]